MNLNPLRWFERKDANLTSSNVFTILGGGGGRISTEAALRCPPVQCAVRAIAETIGSLPVHVFARDEDGSKQRDTTHAAEPLVAAEANPWQSASSLRQQLVIDALTEGNGYAAVVKTENKPREIHRLGPTSTRIEIAPTGEPTYIYTTAAGTRRYAYDEVIHVPSPITIDGYTGIAPTQLASEAIRFALALEKHGTRLFRNAARPGGVLKSKGKIQGPALDRLKASWSAMFAGTENTGSTPILEDGLEWEQLQLTSVDAQFHELRGFAVSEIARAFRVPPVLLMDYGRATWGNSEESGRQFLQFCIRPWLTAIEFAYARALLTKEERSKFYFEFITDDLVRADISKRSEAMHKACGGPWLTANEVRTADNRPTIAGGDTLRPAAKLSVPANDNNQTQDAEAA